MAQSTDIPVAATRLEFRKGKPQPLVGKAVCLSRYGAQCLYP